MALDLLGETCLNHNGGIVSYKNRSYRFIKFDPLKGSHVFILKKYLHNEGNFQYYNDGIKMDISERCHSGFYDYSFILLSKGQPVAVIIYYLNDFGVCSFSVLFIKARHFSVAIKFGVSLFFKIYINRDILMFDTDNESVLKANLEMGALPILINGSKGPYVLEKKSLLNTINPVLDSYLDEK